MTRGPTSPCPECGRPAWTRCWACGWIWDGGSDTGAVVGTLPDDRSEKKIEADVIAALELHGWMVYKTSQAQKPVGMTPGIADLYVVGHGVDGWLECKRPDGTQSPAQRLFEDVVRDNGGRYHIVRSAAEAVAVTDGWRDRRPAA